MVDRSNNLSQRIEAIHQDPPHPGHDPIVVFGLTGRIPTCDHIQIGHSLSTHLGLDQPLPVYYVLNHSPNQAGYAQEPNSMKAFKSPHIATEHRIAMLAIALQSYPHCIAKSWELHGQGPSYSIDTVEALYHLYPTRAILLITGQAYAQTHRWHRGHELDHFCHQIGITNAGHSDDNFQPIPLPIATRQAMTKPVSTHHPGQHIVLSGADLGLSPYSTSSAIAALKKGDHPTNMPPAILKYLIDSGLIDRFKS